MNLANIEKIVKPDITVFEILTPFTDLAKLFFRDMTIYLDSAKCLKDEGYTVVKKGLDKITDCYLLEFVINRVNLN